MFMHFSAFAQAAQAVAQSAPGGAEAAPAAAPMGFSSILLLVGIGIAAYLVFRKRGDSGGGAPTAGDDNIDV